MAPNLSVNVVLLHVKESLKDEEVGRQDVDLSPDYRRSWKDSCYRLQEGGIVVSFDFMER